MSEKQERMRVSILGFLLVAVVLVGAIVAAWQFNQPRLTVTVTTSMTLTTTTSVTETTATTATVTITLQPMGRGDFSLPVVARNGLTGQTLTLSDFRGRVIVLEFIETWCPHCQRMAPIMERLYQNYSGQVVFVSVGARDLEPRDVANFIRNYNSSLTYVHDSSGAVFKLYGVVSVPTCFIISREGKVAATFQGETSYKTLAATIDAQLGSK
jgi:thiol-disulfide isomerase/thioredoxin